MRKMFLLGAAAAALLLGAANAYALPPNSPYAIFVPESVDGANSGAAGYWNPLGAVFEGRSAYVAGAPDYAYAPGASQVLPAEDWTYYSRGR